jgi:hypothetical protein
MEHQPLTGFALLLPPSRRDALRKARLLDQVDLPTRAELANIARSPNRTSFSAPFDIAQRAAKGCAAGKFEVPRMDSSLGHANMNVNELQMSDQRPRDHQRRLKNDVISVAASHRNENSLHRQTLPSAARAPAYGPHKN